jgi:MtN3 and saliva related transmembrane protein
MEIDTIVGISAAILTMSSFVPQIAKAVKTRRTVDISVYLMPLFITGFSLWVVYGFMQNDLVIVGSNLTGIAFNVTLLLLKGRYKIEDRTKSRAVGNSEY